MAKETNVEKLCDRELLEKILSIVERQEKLPPPAHEGGHRLVLHPKSWTLLGCFL